MRSFTLLSLCKLVLLALLLGGVAYTLCCTEFARSDEAVRDWIGGFDPVLARLVYIGVYIIATCLLFPVIILSFCGGLLFGAYEGTLYTWFAATIGSTLAFYLARFLGRDFVEQLLAGRFEELQRRLENHGFTSLLVLRLLPWFPMNGINFGSGLTSIRPRDYILATAIGILPGTFINVYLSASLGNAFRRGAWEWSKLAEPELLIPLVLFVSFLAFGRWLSRRMRR